MRFEVLQRQTNGCGRVQWYWQLTSANGIVLRQSSRGHDDMKTCYRDLQRVKGSSAIPVANLVTGDAVLVLTE
jgi:hypothetical protein